MAPAPFHGLHRPLSRPIRLKVNRERQRVRPGQLFPTIQTLDVCAEVFPQCGRESGVERGGKGYRLALFHLILVQNSKDAENSE